MQHLVPHPDTPPTSVRSVDAFLTRSETGEIWLEFYAYSDGSLLLSQPRKPAKADGLWQTTCFELFARIDKRQGYLEFNFSPSGEWAAYSFQGYREGMVDWPADDPEIWASSDTSHFTLAVEALPNLPKGKMQIALSAVIEEKDGTKSYWALRHPPGKPDFHHPDCFALTLEAPEAA